VSGLELLLSGLTVRYGAAAAGRAPAIDRLSLELREGERAALVGLNGSGKTTLLLAVAGLVPHEGVVEVGGVRLSRKSMAAIRARIGMVFAVPEDQLLFPRVRDDVAWGLVRRGHSPAEAAEQARGILAELGAGHLAEQPLHALSHGQKQRVALAGALVARPRLLLLDEPSAGLDPPARRALARTLAATPAAMLVATHDLDLAALFCSRFLLLENGRIAADVSDPGSIVERWGRETDGRAAGGS
jgi:cobalt/nickel transport system ATP-binding protein